MPIHEYVCADCDQEFEELVRGDERVACPRCHGTRATKKLSTFATARSGDGARGETRASATAPTAGGCGTCGDPRGPGSCAN